MKMNVVIIMEVVGNIVVLIVLVFIVVYVYEGFDWRMDGVKVLFKII